MGKKGFTIVALLVGWTAWATSSARAETTPEATSGPDPAAAAAAVSPAAPTSSEETIARLRDVAYGKNSAGEFREPSARVREAAKQALVLMGENIADGGKGLSPAGSVSQPAGPQSQAGVAANRQVDYRAESPTGTTSDVLPLAPQPPGFPAGQMQLAEMQAPPTSGQPAAPPTSGQPVVPPSSGQPVTPPTSTTELGSNEPSFFDVGALERKLNAPSGAPAGTMTQGQVQLNQPTDTASALADTNTAGDIEVQRRSSLTFDPHVSGFRWGQVYTDVDGAYWTPARLDMDTMLSKVDPGMINNVTVIPGPYGVSYGPGFAFIDVNRTPTPRHDCFQANSETSLNVNSNGGQIYARETVTGGGSDWGFLGSYGERDGNDYLAGNGQKMPTEYHAHDAWGEVGYDINPHQHLDFTYTRLDMADTQIPGQFFDIGELTTNGFLVRVVDDDPDAPWTKLSISGWYNSTGFSGSTVGNTNSTIPVVQRITSSLDQQYANTPNPNPPPANYDPTNTYGLNGTTAGFQYSTGFRMGLVFGDKDCVQLKVGADCRYLGQVINENFQEPQTSGTLGGVGPFTGLPDNTFLFNTNMPQSYMVDPGVYAELSLPVTDLWTVSLGGRGDYVHTSALSSQLRLAPDGTYDGYLPNQDLERDDLLSAFYLTNQCKLGDHWTLTGGFGVAQSPPALIQRYADGLFLAALQSGLTRVVGDPQLNPERDWQLDLGISSSYENWRSKGSIFFAYVQDYITYSGQEVLVPAPPPPANNTTPFPDAQLLQYTNTKLASLAGFQIQEEYDVNEYLTPYAKMSYTEGTDNSLGGPLPSMSPLNSMVGLRIHDADKGRHWGLESNAQIVAKQTRLGEILENGVATPVETPTDAFIVCNLRGYYNYSKNLSFVAGIDNVFNTNYQTALDIRYQAITLNGTTYPAVKVLEPGISPYFGLNWKF